MPEFDFASLVKEIANKHGKKELSSVPPMAIPFPSFILRLLFQNEGLVLGKIIHIVGVEATFKSTLALEITRWHLSRSGYGITLHTESRVNPEIIRGVLGEYEDRHHVMTCDSLEEWQASLMEASKKLGEEYKTLACFTVDSVMGVGSTRTISEIAKDGFASSKFAHEANLIASYLRAFNSKLYDRPHTICLINHRKFRPNPNNFGPPEKAALGGNEIRFCASFEIETSASGSRQVLGPITTYEMGLKLEKNTFGQEDVQIKVPIRFVNTPDETNVIFDWYAASTYFFAKYNNVKPVPSPSITRKLSEVLNVSSRRGGSKGELFYSPQLGIGPENAISATEFGIALEENQEILSELYRIFGIFRRYMYNPELSYDENLKEAEAFYSNLRSTEIQQSVPNETEDVE